MHNSLKAIVVPLYILEPILNLIEKQQKEIEYWKDRTKYYEEQEREKVDLETEIRFYRDSFTGQKGNNMRKIIDWLHIYLAKLMKHE